MLPNVSRGWIPLASPGTFWLASRLIDSSPAHAFLGSLRTARMFSTPLARSFRVLAPIFIRGASGRARPALFTWQVVDGTESPATALDASPARP